MLRQIANLCVVFLFFFPRVLAMATARICVMIFSGLIWMVSAGHSIIELVAG